MTGDTREVEIVWAYNPETDGPDLDRIGTRLTLPKVEARQLVNEGSVRYVDVPVDDADRALANLPRTVAAERAKALGLAVDVNESKSAIIARIAEAEAVEKRTDAEAELATLTKAELRDRLPDDADMPASATKAELVEAVADAKAPDAEVPADTPVETAPPAKATKKTPRHTA